jgi:transcription elongation factor GreA
MGVRYGRSVEQRISRGVDSPALAARLIEHYAASPDDVGAPPTEALLIGAIRLLERELPDGVPARLVAMLAEDGLLRRAMAKSPPGEGLTAQIESSILSWAGSELRLAPVLDLLRAIGLTSIAVAYERRRKERAQSLLEGKSVEDHDSHLTVMSRPTYERLEREMKKLSLDLKTSIPAAIEKARQLGDLRENAEYEAAKLRQATAAARLQELITTLERTRLLDTIEIDETRIGVGTEVALEPLEGERTPIRYWILGEGDGGLGPGVLSYRAELARPLLGREAGAEVVLEHPEGPRRYRIQSIAKRLPT